MRDKPAPPNAATARSRERRRRPQSDRGMAGYSVQSFPGRSQAKFQLALAKFYPPASYVDGASGANSGQCQPENGRTPCPIILLPNCGRHRLDCDRHRSDCDRHQPYCGRHRPDYGRHRPDCGRHRPKFVPRCCHWRPNFECFRAKSDRDPADADPLGFTGTIGL